MRESRAPGGVGPRGARCSRPGRRVRRQARSAAPPFHQEVGLRAARDRSPTRAGRGEGSRPRARGSARARRDRFPRIRAAAKPAAGASAACAPRRGPACRSARGAVLPFPSMERPRRSGRAAACVPHGRGDGRRDRGGPGPWRLGLVRRRRAALTPARASPVQRPSSRARPRPRAGVGTRARDRTGSALGATATVAKEPDAGLLPRPHNRRHRAGALSGAVERRPEPPRPTGAAALAASSARAMSAGSRPRARTGDRHPPSRPCDAGSSTGEGSRRARASACGVRPRPRPGPHPRTVCRPRPTSDGSARRTAPRTPGGRCHGSP